MTYPGAQSLSPDATCANHSFRAGGAFTHMPRREVGRAGVAAESGGNHGAATACAAIKAGRRATIFVPNIASPAKIEQIRSYGAELRVMGDQCADALAASEAFVHELGALAVQVFDQPGTAQVPTEERPRF